MTYYAEISVSDKNDPSKDRSIFREAFGDGTPLENRRAAIAKIKELIAGVKSQELYQLLESLQVVQFVNGITGQSVVEKTKDILLNDYCYSVYFLDDAIPGPPLAIESSHWPEENLDLARMAEYACYIRDGHAIEKEPKEVYIPQFNAYYPVLAEDPENDIGLKQLLLTGP